MFIRILAGPFVLLVLIFLYLTWEVSESYALYIVPPVVILALIYIFSPQINWWWHLRRPPKPDPMVTTLIGKHLPFFSALSAPGKKRFLDRVSLYTIAREFTGQAIENVPADVKGLIAASAVWITFAREDFLLDPYERIILYPHPFPSPQFPEKAHTSETYHEDGVLLFSVDHFMHGFTDPKRFYHLGLHEFAKVFIRKYPAEPYPQFGAGFWDGLLRVSGFRKEAIEKWIGLPQEDSLPIAIVHFFSIPDRFRKVFPGEYEMLVKVFGFDPEPGRTTAW